LENADIFMAIGNILRTFGIVYNHLVHFVFIWYIFPVLVSCTNKNLATLGPEEVLENVFTYAENVCRGADLVEVVGHEEAVQRVRDEVAVGHRGQAERH
jgi:hypothetical protein